MSKLENNVRVYRNAISNIALTDHYKLFNIFMIFEMHKARNLFNYYFLSNGFSACESLSTSLFNSNEKSNIGSLGIATLQNIIEDFSYFYDLVRSFVNSKEVRAMIGEFKIENFVDQEGSFPLLVPIKIVENKILVDEDIISGFLLYIKDSFTNALCLNKFKISSLKYDTTRLYKLFIDNFYEQNINIEEIKNNENISERVEIQSIAEYETTTNELKQRFIELINNLNQNSLSVSFKNAFPLWVKITEKCRYKNFAIKKLEKIIRIREHSKNINNINCKQYYYCIPNLDPIYIQNKTESSIEIKDNCTDSRDKDHILFDMLTENIEEAFTSEKAKRTFDNSFLEFLGEGVISLILGWNCALFNSNKNIEEVMNLTKIKTHHNSMFNIIVDEERGYLDYIGIPIHKTLEFFIPSIVKPPYYLQTKFFNRNPEFFSKLEEIKGNYIEFNNNNIDEEDCDEFQNVKKPYQDYYIFISELNKEFNDAMDNSKYSFSTESKKNISKYFKGLHINYLKQEDIISIFKALVGAIYNCCSFEGVNRLLKEWNFITDECICAYNGDIKKEFPSYNNYHKIINKFSKLNFHNEIEMNNSIELIFNLTGYRFDNPNVLIVALTNKSRQKFYNRSICNDNSLMGLIGKCALRFFNSKRLIIKRNELLLNYSQSLPKISKLKSLLASTERNIFLGLICIKSGICDLIHHNLRDNNIPRIKEFIKETYEDLHIDDIMNFNMDMLAEVVNAIFGAILIDSYDLSRNPDNESSEYLVKYELIYNDIVVKRNYYLKSEQRRYKKFISELKRETKTIIVPLFERDRRFGSLLHQNHLMKMHDSPTPTINCSEELKENKSNIKIDEITFQKIELSEKSILKIKKEWNEESLKSFDEWVKDYYTVSSFNKLLIRDISQVND